MKKPLLVLFLALACAFPALAKETGDENKIPHTKGVALDGPAAVERDFDHKKSPYFTRHDFYNMKSTKSFQILPRFKTIQQEAEWTCGPASALMVMEYFGMRGGRNEADLVALRQNPNPGASTLRQMMNIFDGLGGYEYLSTYDIDPQYPPREDFLYMMTLLKLPVIIGWNEWGGHWQVVIGYDTMGTSATQDDVLILADPYDTTDHDQNGYVVQPFQRFYYNWNNRFDPVFKQSVFLVAWPQGTYDKEKIKQYLQ